MSDLGARVAQLERLVASLLRRQTVPVSFARSTAPPNDAGVVQTIQGQMDALSRRDAMPVLFHYGFSSAMPVGGDKVVNYLTADRSSGVVVATGHQTYRLTGLNTGEVAIYDMFGNIVKLTASGVFVTGNLYVSGVVVAGYGGADQVGLQTHTHTQPNDSRGDTEQPTAAPTAGT